MQTFYNLTPAEQYKYTGAITEGEIDDLLAHDAALEQVADILWDIEQAVESRKPKAVIELLTAMRKVLDEAGV